MSLMSSRLATDRVTVVQRANKEDARGYLSPVETGRVTGYGRIQESTTEDISALSGVDAGVLHMKRFICADFPGDDLSQVIDSGGRVYNVVGEPKRHHGSRRTHRSVVMLKQTSVKRGG